ncbi:DUF4357 domain-containing protein [Arthrobacter mobilis]|uniref:DUF4357 domain-containing protein n=1 Tax=Arthrobacter mobilis TaxID=2724944 RepID=A0A7X6HHN2_9MICC|nr:DUF4357 domain-containing protein [Arthrobacter mobilis]NKX56271.1 DUF4357 domain-containing protein [Arthrobacter mobilis]
MTSIFHGFEEYLLPDDTVKTAALTEGFVALDANVLLNLYKMDDGASKVWMKAFEALGPRLWVPHQAMVEFWRNRARTAVHPITANQARNKIISAQRTIEDEYHKWSSSRGHGDLDAAILEEAISAVQKIIVEIDDFIDSRKVRFSVNPNNDEVVNELERILAGKIGSPYPDDEYREQIETAKSRFDNQIPPGYIDAEKGTDKQYGDFLLWRQVLDHAKTLRSKGRLKIVLVTAEKKDDWWRKVETSEENSGHRAPRFELLLEAKNECNADLIMLSPSDFLTAAETAFKIGLSEEIIKSTQAASSEPGADEATIIEDTLYLRAFGHETATGKEQEGGGILVLSGTTRSVPTQTTPAHIVSTREKLLNGGIFRPRDSDTWELTEPYLFSSASTAAAVMLGRSANGLDEWKNRQGLSIKQLREAQDAEN